MTDLVLAAQRVALAPDVSVGHLLMQMVLWLGVIVVALWGLSKLARRSKGMGRRTTRTAKVSGTQPSTLTVVSRQPVGKGQWIAVVEAGAQRFVVGITGAGFTPLGELRGGLSRGDAPPDDAPRGDAHRDEGPATSFEPLFAEGQGERPRGLLDRARAATVRR